MKKNLTDRPVRQISLKQRMAFSFCFPVIMILMVGMIVFLGFKRAETDQRLIREKLSQAGITNPELAEVLDNSKKSIESLRILLITVTIASIICVLLMAALVLRSVPPETGESFVPELKAMRQRLDEILTQLEPKE